MKKEIYTLYTTNDGRLELMRNYKKGEAYMLSEGELANTYKEVTMEDIKRLIADLEAYDDKFKGEGGES